MSETESQITDAKPESVSGEAVDTKTYWSPSDSSFAFVTGVPFLVIGMLVMWAGVYGLREPLEIFQAMSLESYNSIKIVLSIVVVLFSIVSVNRGWITEGLMFLFIGMSSLTTAFSIKMGYPDITILDPFFGMAIIVCAVFMIQRKARYRGYATLFAGISLIVPNVVEEIPYFSAAMLVISGILFILYFGFVMFYLETGKEVFNISMDTSGNGRVSNSYEIVLIVGFLIVGLILVFDGIMEIKDESFVNTSLSISILIMSMVTTVTAIYASIKGETPEAILILMISIYYLFMMAIICFGQSTVPIAVEMITSAVIFSTFIVFVKRRDWLLSLLSLLAFVQGMIVSPLTSNGSTVLTGYFSIAEAALCIYIALSIWCVVELKRELLPIFNGFERGDDE